MPWRILLEAWNGHREFVTANGQLWHRVIPGIRAGGLRWGAGLHVSDFHLSADHHRGGIMTLKLLGCVALATLSAFAQSDRGTLTGTVADSVGHERFDSMPACRHAFNACDSIAFHGACQWRIPSAAPRVQRLLKDGMVEGSGRRVKTVPLTACQLAEVATVSTR